MPLVEQYYQSPLGVISLVASEKALIGAWFLDQKHFHHGLEEACVKGINPILKQASDWLDAYFRGEIQPLPDYLIPNGTAFQKEVWQKLLTIPYGETTSYGKIAKDLGCASAQAVGGAVGRNPLSLFIPCHRVLSADGGLTQAMREAWTEKTGS
ncbi:methylated-DNA-[protein]-cysteine S-methyltransferase, DNA-binding domain protein [Streptococcus ictaluri 707-05]|uniref:Methylated-DNA-[protein]-cysteine S-methyltransferase, DNA-binding domain protein n=1 Tax=Streptococcus ictaluri 707-05 TaxID=764299 RepID=G5K1J5_9STRE|nr:methylated-DNA-[protein]-cysteine S-methyltransferase, DNA-binding domain protein [Streptococcus ictaluri 707-05]